MGTRNLVAVHLEGQYRIAQYGQWDGYPDGQGKTVLEFLASLNESGSMVPPVEKFKENLRQCSYLTNEEMKDPKFDCEDWAKKWPELSRDAGADVLAMVAERPLKLKNSIAFAGESLFCEWAYVIDFDTNTPEVFKGFNHDKLKNGERFYDWPKENPGSKYEPVKLAKSYSLDDLPTVEQMIADCCPPEAE